LLAKYKLMRELGTSSIVQGKVPNGPIEVALREGKLRTIGYGACLRKIEENEGFSESEQDLAHRLQDLRTLSSISLQMLTWKMFAHMQLGCSSKR
jgi:hypothetical protein